MQKEEVDLLVKKVIIYGIGESSCKYLKNIEHEFQIIGVSDGKKRVDKWEGYQFIEPTQLKKYCFDYVVVPSFKYYAEIVEHLEGLGIEKCRIIRGWYKQECEFSYWTRMLSNEKEFFNDGYERVMLCLAEENNDDFLRGKIIADFGCGPRGSLAWTNKPLLKIGIDVLIQKYMEITDLTKHGTVYVTAKEDKIPMPDECVDYMIAMEVLDRVNDIGKTVSEITRILKTGGIFAGSFPLNENADEGQPQSFDLSVIDLLNDNYKIISKRVAKRASDTGEHFEPYLNMLQGHYVSDLKCGEKGFLWFRAVKI